MQSSVWYKIYPCSTIEISLFNDKSWIFTNGLLIALLEYIDYTVLFEYLDLHVKVTMLYKRFVRYNYWSNGLTVPGYKVNWAYWLTVTSLLWHPVSSSIPRRRFALLYTLFAVFMHVLIIYEITTVLKNKALISTREYPLQNLCRSQ